MAKETAQDRLRRELESGQTMEFHAFLGKAGHNSGKLNDPSKNTTELSQKNDSAADQTILDTRMDEHPEARNESGSSLQGTDTLMGKSNDLQENTEKKVDTEDLNGNPPVEVLKVNQQDTSSAIQNLKLNDEEVSVGKPAIEPEQSTGQDTSSVSSFAGRAGNSQIREKSKVKLEIHSKTSGSSEPTKPAKIIHKKKESSDYREDFLDKKLPIKISNNRMKISEKAYQILHTLSKGACLEGAEVGITQLLNNILENHFEVYREEILPYLELYKKAEQERVNSLTF